MERSLKCDPRSLKGQCSIEVGESEKLLGPVSSRNSGLLIEFDDLSYCVCENRRGNTKKILHNVFGCFRPNGLTAIIGPSGAGKSTLLGIISSLKTTNVKGSIKVNGHEGNELAFRKQTCFVPQEFALLPLLTAKETLYIACKLKLGQACKSRSPTAIICEVAENLGLTKNLDTLVENLSGGERKRLSIAIEIITKPSVLLLDEPTSGLDSASSNQVISLLHDIAKSGCTVVCAIHQPSCRMISQFDDVLVIDKGKSYYWGPKDDILSTFSNAGFVCPPFYNIAEFVLEVVTEQRHGDLDYLSKVSRDKYLKWKVQNVSQQIEVATTLGSTEYSEKHAAVDGSPEMLQRSLSVWQEQAVLFLRALICIKRDNTMTKLRLAAHVVVALLLGIVFYDVGNNAAKTTSNISSVFFVLLFLYFSSSMPAVQMFPIEAAVFFREYLNNWYRLRSYFIVKMVSDLPLQILCPSVFISITYYLTGQPMECQRFVQTWILCLLTTIVGQSSGILTGVTFNTQIGIFLIPALSMPMILFAGFFLKFSEMPQYLQPLCALSFFRYAFEGILQAIYAGDREKLPCPETFCFLRKPKNILDYMNMPTMEYYTTVLVLAGWILVLQTLVYLVLKWKAYLAKK